ncbi:MAG: YXWGXW repeat-containing protein [Verrucomicrobia bacterium]|nr:YXWGXW repeat-containing protein [Verrucomicrobiota bacterium]
MAGGIAGATIGNSLDHERGTLYTSEAQATTDYVVAQPPPAPPIQREVVVVQPAPGMVWVQGYWAYDGYRYVWIGGRWVRPPHRHYRAYVAPHWEYRGRGYVYIQGYWR